MNTVDPSDFDIITRIHSGEKEQYRLLIERYTSLVFHVVHRYEGDKNMVTEMAHEIFLKAYERLDSFENNSAFSSWLYRLAQNYCIDHTRRKNYRNRLFSELSDDHSENMSADEPIPDDALEAEEQSNRLYQALNRIDENHSLPLLMKYRDGMSYEAIAEILKVSEGTLKVRVHRARKELKQLMEQSK